MDKVEHALDAQQHTLLWEAVNAGRMISSVWTYTSNIQIQFLLNINYQTPIKNVLKKKLCYV